MLSKLSSGSPIVRFVGVLAVLLFMVGTMGVGVAEGKKKKPKAPPPPPADLPGHLSYLAWQLRGMHLDESEPITGKIEKLVLDHLQEWLASTSQPVTSVEVRRELEKAFVKLRYPTYAKPACFDEPWKGGMLIGAGYTLGWSDYDRVNVVALFEHWEGKVRLAAVTKFVPRTDLRYEFMRLPDSDVFRFFIYGFRLGKSQLRLSAILYAFDGQSLTPQWETRDVYDGKMDVGQEKVIIRYLKEDEYIRETVHGRKPPRHAAIYRITSQGLELETDHEIPF